MIAFLNVEWSINLTNFGSTTFQTNPRGGFEADKAYYLDARRRIADIERIDLTIDPPPDLVVEVDIASSSSNRPVTYAALAVPEVWRFYGGAFSILALIDGAYEPIETSRIIRGLPAAEVAFRIERGNDPNDEASAVLAEWQHWLRENHQLHETA